MVTKDDILQIYEETKDLGKFDLPDHLWENGVFVYTEMIDRVRSNQECLSETIIRVSREKLKVGALLRMAAKTADANWPEKLPKKSVLEDLELELIVLLDNLKLLHGECNRARSDLKTKVQLMEMEAKMGGSGLVGDQRPRTDSVLRKKRIPSTKAVVDGRIEWDSPDQ